MTTPTSCNIKRAAPTWKSAGQSSADQDSLYLYNSFTRQKELFTTRDSGGKNLTWYTCGPTVYDESHMGHARCYISTDILRRTLRDYFNYDITFTMNITDIDDKIILRARKHHLFQEYLKKSVTDGQAHRDVSEAFELMKAKSLGEEDKDKKVMYEKMLEKTKLLLESKTAKTSELLAGSEEIVSAWLDKFKGSTVTDNSIFQKLARHYEADFHKDMHSLNILPPTVLTRVSEYVPEVVEFIEKIISNGYAYESQGSVYFDTVKYDASEDHYYAKLMPEAFGDSKALAEGEGALSAGTKQPDSASTGCSIVDSKRNVTDFALWKFSKPGEPSWESPWGKGRPGWHIECSAMAGAVFDSAMDIHSGGIDLKFPHHDNEIAQSEAAFCCNDWVNFFLHSGHLHIQGCKMSKSLKNFITIKQSLEKYTARQLRLLFLLHAWKDVLDYSDAGMDGALGYERTLKEYFFRVKDFSRDVRFDVPEGYSKVTKVEKDLLAEFAERKRAIHKALCDSINTAGVMKEITTLISACNTYMSGNYNLPTYNHMLMNEIALYITNMMRTFGVVESISGIGFGQSASDGSSESNQNKEELLMPYLNALSKFRDEIRVEARAQKQFDILKICDQLRDEVLPNLGVLIEDLSDRTVVKLSDRDTLLKEKEQKQLMVERKKTEELKRQEELLKEKLAKEAKKSIPPSEMFLKETDKYSKFDERGVPTHDAAGEELTKSASKKLMKAYEAQKKGYEDYLKKKAAAITNEK